jgi:hypothetical protein
MTSRFKKRPLPLHALGPADLGLGFAHLYWSRGRDGGLLPPRCRVDTPEFRLLVEGADWIDVAAAEPACWRLGRLAALLRGLPAGPAEASLRRDLEAARFTGSPLLQDLVLATPAHTQRYRQLVLPCADDGRQVRDLLVLLAPLAEPVGWRPPAPATTSSHGEV